MRMGYFAKRNFAFYATHTCLCVAFLMLPYIFTASGSFMRIPKLYSNGHDRVYFAVYFSLMLFFYLNYYVLIPRLYYAQKRVWYFSILAVFLGFFLFMAFYFDRPEVSILKNIPGNEIVIDQPGPPPGNGLGAPGKNFGPPGNQFGNPPQMPPMTTDGTQPDHAFRPNAPQLMPPGMMKPNENAHTILIFLISVLASLFLTSSRRLQASERDRMEAELSLLKAQINPHFLFNTLNSIYALAIRKDERTADSVVQLSELMRYIMNNAHTNAIGLEKEIHYIDNYISLQRSRLGDTAKIEYVCTGTPYAKQITPLILISFIENAFKHGVNPDENSEIHISIDIVGSTLTLFVANRKVHSVHHEGGIGLVNTRERLEMLYSGRHTLDIREDDEHYSVTLTLEL